MAMVRKIAEAGHAKRKEAQIKLRQPLASLNYKFSMRLDKQLEQILAEELNVKKIEYTKKSKTQPEIELDTNITPILKKEGEARELIRQIQQLRKDKNLTLADKTKIIAPSWPKDFENLILISTASISIVKGSLLEVMKSQ